MLTRQGCAARQARLLGEMERAGVARFVTRNYRTVYWLTGSLCGAEAPVMFGLEADGRSVLVTAGPGEALADRVIPVETYSIQRVVDRPWQDAHRLFREAWGCDAEKSSWGTAAVLRLRKRKEADEIAEISGSLRLIRVAYDAARATIAPGLTELDVYNAMQAAVVKAAGTFVQLWGDFAVGERAIRGGGPPTARVIEARDLYILDLFPAPALYFGDTCRTFAVGEPSELQMRAWEAVCEAVRIGEAMVKPGVLARDVYRVVKEFLDSFEFGEKSFWHHAGHGIGHFGHEAPRIIPGSDEVFEVGDVITLEPGIYTKALQGGIRLEDNYVVREDGLENLLVYPKDL